MAELRAENARLRAEVTRLCEQVAKLNDRLGELLAVAKKKKSGPAKPAPKPPVAAVAPEGDAREAFTNRPLAPELPAAPEKPKKKQRPTGRKPLPSHLPDDVHVFAPTACACCGSGDLDMVDEVIETKLDTVKEHQRKRIVHRKTARCRRCGDRTTARSLPAPFERSKVTCDWLSWLVWTKFVLQVPLDRTRRAAMRKD